MNKRFLLLITLLSLFTSNTFGQEVEEDGELSEYLPTLEEVIEDINAKTAEINQRNTETIGKLPEGVEAAVRAALERQNRQDAAKVLYNKESSASDYQSAKESMKKQRLEQEEKIKRENHEKWLQYIDEKKKQEAELERKKQEFIAQRRKERGERAAKQEGEKAAASHARSSEIVAKNAELNDAEKKVGDVLKDMRGGSEMDEFKVADLPSKANAKEGENEISLDGILDGIVPKETDKDLEKEWQESVEFQKAILENEIELIKQLDETTSKDFYEYPEY